MYGSLINRIYENSGNPTPEVGMGVTICQWSDRSAGTITAVRLNKDGSVKEIEVTGDKATRTDKNGMSDAQAYSYERAPEGTPASIWRVDGKGRYRRCYVSPETGKLIMCPPKAGPGLSLGHRDAHYDYSF